jgi:hypothetical protein
MPLACLAYFMPSITKTTSLYTKKATWETTIFHKVVLQAASHQAGPKALPQGK